MSGRFELRDELARGPKRKTVERKHRGGYLRLRYGAGGEIQNISWSRAQGGAATGLQLYFDWTNQYVTCKTEHGLSGSQWAAGRVAFGTVYDDDSPGPAPPGRAIALDAWVDECLAKFGDP